MANYRHGLRTREAIAERKRQAAALRAMRKVVAALAKGERMTWDDLAELDQLLRE